jgi:2,3-diketo-5-methylthio-1-phosphopentane phosphatase
MAPSPSTTVSKANLILAPTPLANQCDSSANVDPSPYTANDYLTDHHGFGYSKRRQGNIDTLNDKVLCRDAFREMVESWQLSFPECMPILRHKIKLDPHFAEFYKWSVKNNVPVIVLSSGMVPIIRALLQHLLGKEEGGKIEVVANMPVGRPPLNDLNVKGGWTVQYHDDSGFGHDKSLTIRPYAEAIAKMPRRDQPTLLYAGDGISDVSAARETDLLFAKKGHDLVTFCEREGLPFTLFEDWGDILTKTKDIYEGKTDVRRVAEAGKQEAQRDPEKVAEMRLDEPGKTEMVR